MDSFDSDVAAYRSLSRPAAAGLILGSLSFTAFLHPAFWAFPAFAFVFSLWGIFAVLRRPNELIGLRAAQIGLVLAAFFGAAAPCADFCYRNAVRAEARQFAATWFQLLADGRPELAHMLTLAPDSRRPLDDAAWDLYKTDLKQRVALESYVAPTTDAKTPNLIRVLLALGKKAEVRYFDTISETVGDNGGDLLLQRYSVTYAEDGKKKSFFIHLQMAREHTPDGRSVWTLLGLATQGKPKEAA